MTRSFPLLSSINAFFVNNCLFSFAYSCLKTVLTVGKEHMDKPFLRPQQNRENFDLFWCDT